VKKIIVCSSRLVAAMTNYSVLIDASANFACFRPDTTVVLWTRDSFYVDIAFHRGKIFAIKTNEHLFSRSLELDGGVQSLQSPANLRENFSLHALVKEVPSPQGWTEHAIKEGPAAGLEATHQNHLHLINSSDEQKLLMVRWSIPHQADNRVMNLQVFEADLDKGNWSEVKDLARPALEHFLLEACQITIMARKSVEEIASLFSEKTGPWHTGAASAAKSSKSAFLPIVCMICQPLQLA
jgi:hypothetical protein